MCQEGRLSGVTSDPSAIKGPDPGGIWGQVAAHPSLATLPPRPHCKAAWRGVKTRGEAHCFTQASATLQTGSARGVKLQGMLLALSTITTVHFAL